MQRAIAYTLSAVLLLAVTATASRADERCSQLESLARQYAGVQLTVYQQQMKRQLTAWYHENCTSRRVAARH